MKAYVTSQVHVGSGGKKRGMCVLLVSLALRREMGAFSYKRPGEGRQSSATSSSMKYSLRDTEKRLKRQQCQRSNGRDGGRRGCGGVGGRRWKVHETEVVNAKFIFG